MESRVMEPVHCSGASCISTVVHKSAVALRYQENAFDVFESISGEMVFEIADQGTGREITHPEGMTRLPGFPGWSTRSRWYYARANIWVASSASCEASMSVRDLTSDHCIAYQVQCLVCAGAQLYHSRRRSVCLMIVLSAKIKF